MKTFGNIHWFTNFDFAYIFQSENGELMRFYIPDDQQLQNKKRGGIDKDGRKWVNIQRAMWFTNCGSFPVNYIPLTKKYSPEDYPQYDNYEAIEVSKLADIPYDYGGVMGVPITLLTKYNPDQFEIVGITDRQDTYGFRTKKYTKENEPNYNDLNARAVLKTGQGYRMVYARILIKNKKPIP